MSNQPTNPKDITREQLDGEDEAERKHWNQVARTLLLYSEFFSVELQRRQLHLNKLPTNFAKRLPSIIYDKYELYDEAMNHNQQFLDEVVKFYYESGMSGDDKVIPHKYSLNRIPYSENKRNEAILHSLYREWSEEGLIERNKCFQPIVLELQRLLPVIKGNEYNQHICVPGCGLARLPLEITNLGYSCEGTISIRFKLFK